MELPKKQKLTQKEQEAWDRAVKDASKLSPEEALAEETSWAARSAQKVRALCDPEGYLKNAIFQREEAVHMLATAAYDASCGGELGPFMARIKRELPELHDEVALALKHGFHDT